MNRRSKYPLNNLESKLLANELILKISAINNKSVSKHTFEHDQFVARVRKEFDSF